MLCGDIVPSFSLLSDEPPCDHGFPPLLVTCMRVSPGLVSMTGTSGSQDV